MTNRLFLLFLLTFALTTGHAQKKSDGKKCPLIYQKEFDRKFYTDLDVLPEFVDKKTKVLDFIPKNFKVPNKNYKEGQQIKFAWLVEKNGTSTFLKLLYPKDDKELEEEAKRIISTLPLYTPAMCGHDTVTCKIDINFPLTSGKEKK